MEAKHNERRWFARLLVTAGLGLLLLMACTAGPSPELPTLAAPVTVPPQVATSTALPATSDLSGQQTPLPTPTRPTATPRPSGTPVTPVINIASPDSGAELLLGSEVEVRGLLELRPEQRVLAALVTATGHELAIVEGVVEENSWVAALTVPENVTGVAQLQAAIVDPDGTVAAITAIPVSLVLDANVTSTYLVLFRPEAGTIAVADHNLFFDGFLQRFGGGFLRLSVWVDNCRNKVAEHGFTMRSSSYWQGFVILPRDVSGPGCAVASVGTPGDQFWREAQVPIMILGEAEGDAVGITIASPQDGDVVLSGETILIYGTAYNAPDGELNLTVLLDNGRIITEVIIEADDWGYWEQSIVLPFDVEGQAIIMASLGDVNDPLATAEVRVRIDPGPTPTPGLPATFIATSTPLPTVTPQP